MSAPGPDLTPTNFVRYDPDGTIYSTGCMAASLVQAEIAAGGFTLVGNAVLGVHYVDVETLAIQPLPRPDA